MQLRLGQYRGDYAVQGALCVRVLAKLLFDEVLECACKCAQPMLHHVVRLLAHAVVLS
jgi:hypothetical protein